ncbi:ATPase [Aureococcus anophagefferens]|nr:ATPase [Aureococcus anophagefferens]
MLLSWRGRSRLARAPATASPAAASPAAMAPSSHGRMLLLLAAASAAVVPHDVSAACAHPKETAPTCANNATLFAYLESAKGNKDVQTDNCATCACAEQGNDQWAALNAPARGDAAVFERSWGRCCDGWNGTACDVCETLAACPSRRDPKTGTTVDAYNCTAGLNAYCGYTDLPGASFDVVAFAERAEVAWRLGTFRDDNVHFPKQNFYDYAAYFEGNLTGCSYANDVCAWDDSKKCLTLTCGATAIDCPPAGLGECPGWTYDPCKHHYVCENECVKKSVFGCCKPKDGDDDDVMHGHRYHVNNPLCCAAGTEDGCQPTEIFWNGPATTFSCELDASEPLMPATARRCYLNQKHTGVDGFPLTCHVGNCLYNASQHNSTPPSIVDDDVHFREPRPQRGVVPQLAAANPLFAAEDGDDEAGAPLGGLGGGLDVAWADLTLECGPVVVLDGARGSAAAGEVQAVLGPSGAGKSSLLRCVGGRARGRVSGSVSLGGAALCAAERRGTLAFVPQDDGALPQTLTVAEHLLFHAELRLGDRADAAALAARVAAVLAVLELETCAATLARRGDADDDAADGERGVSGGEARRVSVAAELLGTPAALLLDEPTSRLDLRAALRLTRSLRRVARGGADAAPVAVLATMHQPRPEIFLSLDGLCVVCKGAVAWRGSVSARRRALEPGGCENPGDVLLDAIAARGAGALAGLDDDGGGDEAPERRGRQRRPARGSAVASGGGAAGPATTTRSACPRPSRPACGGRGPPAPSARRRTREVLRGARFERLPPRRQLAILLDRQLLRVFRAPSLLCLHAGGALAAAVCLGSIDSDLPKDLGGAQRRIGAIFFALFFLQLLALSALSTFREDAAVADAERVAVGGALFAALFGGVAVGVDSDTTAHHGAAIETGGGGVVAALSQSLVRAAAAADALFYAFRAAVVGEFAGAKDTVGHLERYVIDGHKCDPTFPSITVDVNAILSTLSLPTGPAAADAALARLALVAACCLGVAAAAHSLKSSPDFSDGDDERGRSVEIPAVDDPELQLSDSPPRGRPVPRHLGHAWGSSERLLTDDDARSDGEPAPPPPLRRVDDAGGEALRTKRPAIAWALPALVGGVVFANHYARDTPSALQEALEARWPMSSLQFGLLHNVYYVPNVFMPLVAGAMAQAAADATAPLVFFTGCACAGHALWAAGVGARSFPLLLGARCVLGACYEAIDLGSIPFMGPIFRDDWAKVVGVTNALLRVGSVATFGLSPALLAAFGLDAPLYAAGAVGAASGAGGAAGDVLVVRPRRRAGLRGRRDLARARVEDPRGPLRPDAAADGLILCPEAAIVVLGPAVGFLVDKKRSALTARLVAAAVSALSFPLAFGAYYGDGSSGLAYGTLVLSAGWSVFNTLFWATITVVSPPEALPVATGVVGALLNVGPAALPALLAVAPKSRALLALACVSAAGAACLAVAAACVPPPEAPLPPPEDDDDALFGEAPPPRLACRDVSLAAGRRLSSAFAPQDDVLPPHLTCREHLTFHAKLRLPGAWPAARKRRVARAEADALALDARCYEETRLGKASGGQRRRVTLATTLLAKRQLLFCDEPTTGLDAATALVVCRRLQDVSRLGVTVVAVLHQPRREIFVALDRVALLVRGRLRVCGTPADVRAALDARAADGPMASNPADAMLDLAQAPGGLAVAASDAADAPSPQRRGRRRARPAPVGGFQALCLLATRERRQCLRDGPLLVLQYVPALVVGAILGLVYEDLPSRNGQAAGIQDRLGLAFVLCTSLGLSALSAPPRSRRAARLLARERDSYGFAQAFAAAAYVGEALPLRVAPPLALAGLVVGLSHAAKTYNHTLGFVLAAFQIHYVLAATGPRRRRGRELERDRERGDEPAAPLQFIAERFLHQPGGPGARLAGPGVVPAHVLRVRGFGRARVRARRGSLYISSKVGSSKIRTGPYPGEAILHCFGFDADDALADHLALVAFGAGADLLTCLFFGLFAFEKR